MENADDTPSNPNRPLNIPTKQVDPTLSVEERFTENAVKNILPARYLLRDEKGNLVETPTDLFKRVGRNIAEAEYNFGASDEDVEMWADAFTEMMETQVFVPNSPTLMNAGGDLQQLAACFVLEPEDDLRDICKKQTDASLIFQSGGGVGYTFSHLRPKGDPIASTGGYSSGPISFMELFDTTCQTIEQGGKRRGAQMAILRVDHPDVGRFVTAKREEGRFSNFNISVALTDAFIKAVREGSDYAFYNPNTDGVHEVTEQTAYFYNAEYRDSPASAMEQKEGELVDENLWRDYAHEIECIDGDGDRVTLEEKWGEEFESKLVVGEEMILPAEFVWDLIIDGAWRNGEPGLFHWSETNRKHSFDVTEHSEYEVHATNPCAEQPLVNYESCNLGHINLSLMLREEIPTWSEFVDHYDDQDWAVGEATLEDLVNDYLLFAVDMDRLDKTIWNGVRFLDNVIEQSEFPIDEITQRVNELRKIGLGIMGFAQMLVAMGIEYGSEESYVLARQLMTYINVQSKFCSHHLSEERGVFPAWEKSKYADPAKYESWFVQHVGGDPADYPNGFQLRNHNTTTIAPTGTTGMLANTSGGCEPIYSVCYFKNVGGDIQGSDFLVEFDDYFLTVLEANDLDVDAVKAEAERQMRNNEFEGIDSLPIPQEIKDLFVTTADLTAEQHTMMQRAFQYGVDSGISKTMNFGNSATREDIAEGFLLALSEEEYGAAIKGLTAYRDGSREEQVLTTRVSNKIDEDEEDEGACCGDCGCDADSDENASNADNDVPAEDECPDCGAQLILEEGCAKCHCGYEACHI